MATVPCLVSLLPFLYLVVSFPSREQNDLFEKGKLTSTAFYHIQNNVSLFSCSSHTGFLSFLNKPSSFLSENFCEHCWLIHPYSCVQISGPLLQKPSLITQSQIAHTYLAMFSPNTALVCFFLLEGLLLLCK